MCKLSKLQNARYNDKDLGIYWTHNEKDMKNHCCISDDPAKIRVRHPSDVSLETPRFDKSFSSK